MKLKTPEFFINSISKAAENDMIAVAMFSNVIEELFTKS
jgi:hypothetical protein